MRIDSHQHVNWLGKDASAVVAEMDALGIDQAWLLTWQLPVSEDNPSYHRVASPLHLRADNTHAAMPLRDVVDACRRYPSRFVAGYCPDPTEPGAVAQFQAAVAMHGVAVCGEYSYRTLLDDPRAVALFQAAGELGCPVVLHMDVPMLPDAHGRATYQTYWHGGTVANLERALQACPQTIFVGHAPGFWREISGDADGEPCHYPDGPIRPGGRLVPLMRQYPNLWADLSAGSGLTAMRRDAEHACWFIQTFADRLLYGRDMFGDGLHTFLKSLNLPDEVWGKLMWRNAQRLVRSR